MDLGIYKSKRVFITGHTGFKGSWLSKILINAGAEVTGYSMKPPTQPNLFDILNLRNHMRSIIGDIRDIEKLKNALFETKPDIIFHLAAQPIVRESYRKPRYNYEVNVMGTVNILESTRLYGEAKSFLNVTTDKVYQNNEWHWGYRENDRLCGFDPYSNSKSCSELVTYGYVNSFFANKDSTPISTARSGNVIGGGDFAVDRIIPDCIRATENGGAIVVRNPHSIRPYQHVLECLSGYLLLAKKQYENLKYAGCYNFGPDNHDCITTGNLVDLFCSIWGNGLTWVNKWDDGPHESSFLKLDCSKARVELDWKPRWNIEMAVERTVDWVKIYLNNDDISVFTDKQIKDYFEGV